MKKILNSAVIPLIILVLILLWDPLISLMINEKPNASEITALKSENDYLKEQIKLMPNHLNVDNYNNAYANIIFRDIYYFFDEITISIGNNNGIESNMAVINEHGLIGVIKKVGNNSSQVVLITNNDLEVSVMINDTYGILKSNNKKLYVSNIIGDTSINIGDNVYTSGLGNLPSHIFIGTVKEINTNNEIERILVLNNRLDLENIKYVSVLKTKGV